MGLALAARRHQIRRMRTRDDLSHVEAWVPARDPDSVFAIPGEILSLPSHSRYFLCVHLEVLASVGRARWTNGAEADCAGCGVTESTSAYDHASSYRTNSAQRTRALSANDNPPCSQGLLGG